MSSVGSITIRCITARKRVSPDPDWDVLVDGKKIGDLALGEKTFELDAGQHSVQVKYRLLFPSETLHVMLDQNHPIQLECGFCSRSPKEYLGWGIVWTILLACAIALSYYYDHYLTFMPQWPFMQWLFFISIFCVPLFMTFRLKMRPGSSCYLKRVDNEQSA